MRIAIECRDHRRGSDLKWIDELIGKYNSLPVDRIVAVSRQGFSKSALAKADAHRIETRTLKAAMDADWPEELEFRRMAQVEIDITFRIAIETTPPWNKSDAPGEINYRAERMVRTDFDQRVLEMIRQEINMAVLGRVRDDSEDLDELDGTLEEMYEVLLPGATVIGASGRLYELNRVTVQAYAEVTPSFVPTRWEKFGDVGITTGTFAVEDQTVEATMVQAPGEAFPYQTIFSLDPKRTVPVALGGPKVPLLAHVKTKKLS